MPQTTVRADLDQAADVAVDLAAKVSLHLIVAIDDLADVADFGLGKVPNLLGGVDPCLLDRIARRLQPEPVDQGQSVKDRLVSWKVNACNSRHLYRSLNPAAACA